MRNPRRNKLDVRVIDWEDVDTGPTHSRKHALERGWWRDESGIDYMGDDYRYVKYFLRSCVGKTWDDCYSKFCEKYDARSHVGHVMRRDFHRSILGGWGGYDLVDGVITYEAPRRHWPKPIKPPEKIHYYGDVWFERVKCSDLAKCGCVHFKLQNDPTIDTDTSYWRYHDKPLVCIHGNHPIERYRWEVVNYHKTETYQKMEYDRYFRCKQVILRVVVAKKTPNKKELAVIRSKGGIT